MTMKKFDNGSLEFFSAGAIVVLGGFFIFLFAVWISDILIKDAHIEYCYKQNSYAVKDVLTDTKYCAIQEQIERLYKVKRKSS